ncbi:DDE Tnp4 domain-containing protein [Mycena sanguinolenta]|uniref:DDE Tnp4 domain-containing protein n=1 Tax=Mycena sanguinolenta TaxID=230812 RepID=A0A8H7CGI3_9AGAR|nr:DDE Tnp4 domain-containing protein [Mycena sanguinolenta]
MADQANRYRLAQILVAAVPILSQPPPLPPILGGELLGYLALITGQDYGRVLHLLKPSTSSQPRPEQGGHRITEAWLYSLRRPDCVWRFRMTADELVELAEALRIPDPFKTTHRYSFSAVEALCLLCARFRSAGEMYLLAMLYDRSQTAISECINELVELLDDTWEHLLGCDQEHLLHPDRLREYTTAIHNRGAPLMSIFAFIDCTIRRICHPTWYQRQAYNGHKKFHSLKFQALMLPNGIIGHLYGPVEGQRNDNFLLTESALLDALAQFAHQEDVDDDTPIERRYFQIFGDPAYGVGPHIMSPFSRAGVRTPDEQEWNAQMSAVRIEVEHGFGIVANLWPFLNAGWKMQLYSSPVGRYYRVGVLLTNCLNCLHANQVAQYFDCLPPDLEDYLHN